MPELAAIYSIGILASFFATLCHYGLYIRKIHSPKWEQMQKNLILAGLYWSETRGELVRYSAGASEFDRQKYLRQVWILGGLMGLLAWLGFFLQILIIVSLRYLVKSHAEKKILSSKIVSHDMSGAEVRTILRELFVEEPNG